MRVSTTKQMVGLVFVRHIREPIRFLYKLGSTSSFFDASIFFKFVTIGADMGL